MSVKSQHALLVCGQSSCRCGERVTAIYDPGRTMFTLVGKMSKHLRPNHRFSLDKFDMFGPATPQISPCSMPLHRNPTVVTANRGDKAVGLMGKGLSWSAHDIELVGAVMPASITLYAFHRKRGMPRFRVCMGPGKTCTDHQIGYTFIKISFIYGKRWRKKLRPFVPKTVTMNYFTVPLPTLSLPRCSPTLSLTSSTPTLIRHTRGSSLANLASKSLLVSLTSASRRVPQ